MESAGARVMLMRDGEPTSRFQPQVLAFLGLGVVSIRSRVPFGFPQMGQGRVTPRCNCRGTPCTDPLGHHALVPWPLHAGPLLCPRSLY